MHLSVAALSVVAVFVNGSSHLPHRSSDALATLPAAEAASLVRQASARGGRGYLVRAAVPHTTSVGEAQGVASQPAGQPSTASSEAGAVPRTMRTYVVQRGDTVIGLAQRFGITPETILAANSSLAGNPDLLQLDQELLIPPVSGVLHTVVAGDTLSAIAQRYQVSVEAIVGYKENGLEASSILQLGQKVMVPGGVMPLAAARPAPASGSVAAPSSAYRATGRFLWPTTGTITQGSWARHVAIDIGTPTGTPIYASDTGYVLEAGWSNVGYGQYVILDHGNGYRTLYAHMSTIIARKGQWYQKGQKIGLVGSTGRSTGPHLHFEIYKNGVIQNPLAYLP